MITLIHKIYQSFLKTTLMLCKSSASKMHRQDSINRTAGIIIIGDEILKGQVRDTNSHFIVKRLYDLGVRVQRISTVGDDEAAIIEEVQVFSQKYTYVITTGGIGPTHDDITFEAVAKAFGERLAPHPELVSICKMFYKTDDLNSPAMKLAYVPKSAKLNFGCDSQGKRTLYPNVSIKNVYIFPGIPQLMEKSFSILSEDLFGAGKRKFFMKELYIKSPEDSIAGPLSSTAKEFPNVTFGSYPELFQSYYKVRVTVESDSQEELYKAYNKLLSVLEQDCLIDFDKNPLENAHDKLIELVKKQNKDIFKDAVGIMEHCCQNYRPAEVCVYFDGSLESTVTLHLYYALLSKLSCSTKIQAMNVKDTTIPSQNLTTYIQETCDRYNLDMCTFHCPVEEGITALVTKNQTIKVIIQGHRSSNQKTCEKIVETDSGSFQLLLVNPITNWQEVDILGFIHFLYLPYCSLYD